MLRQTAVKMRIEDIVSGKFFRQEGKEPNYLQTESGKKISRVRILAIVVGKFVSEDGMFGSVVLDDGTETIRAKTFKTIKPLENVQVGDVVDVIGKIREWSDEVYIIPEIVHKIKNPNFELLRRLELLMQFEKPIEIKDERSILREKILDLLSKNESLTYEQLLKECENEVMLEAIINELLTEGICYEPSPGKIKKI